MIDPMATPEQERMYATHWKSAAEVPIGVRSRVRSALRHVAISTASLYFKPQSRNFLRCLTCHYVFDDQRPQFERLIKTLTATGQFVTTDTCAAMLEGEVPINDRYFHLSFDDGFRNVITNAFPILSQYRVPAIVFVPTSIVESSWTEVSRYCLETTKYRAVIEMANWADLASIDTELFEVGSHTRTHVRASQISDRRDELEKELSESKAIIEQKLGRECKYLAWPYGQPKDVDQVSLDAAQEAGYRAAFSVQRGTIETGKSNTFFLPRHHFEVQWPLSHITYLTSGHMERV